MELSSFLSCVTSPGKKIDAFFPSSQDQSAAHAEIEIRARQSPAEHFGLDLFFKDPSCPGFERPFLSVGPPQSP